MRFNYNFTAPPFAILCFYLSSLFEIESIVYTHFRRCILSGERSIKQLKRKKKTIETSWKDQTDSPLYILSSTRDFALILRLNWCLQQGMLGMEGTRKMEDRTLLVNPQSDSDILLPLSGQAMRHGTSVLRFDDSLSPFILRIYNNFFSGARSSFQAKSRNRQA